MPTFTTPMPAHTQRAHAEPPWVGDRRIADVMLGRRGVGPDGVRAIDHNFQVSGMALAVRVFGFEIWNVHWADPFQNNYRYIVDAKTGLVRHMTQKELHKPIHKWKTADVYRWRRGATKRSARPRTWAETLRDCKANNVVPTPECKSPYFRRRIVARKMIADAKAQNMPCWPMALYGSMPYCRGKCRAFKMEGAPFAAIFGRYQYLKKRYREDVKSWRYKPTHTW